MCGDGTNDVGALKHAHVGVSLLSNASIKLKKKPDPAILPFPTIPPTVATNSRVRPTPGALALTARERAIARHRDASQALQKAMKDIEEDQVQIVKLGDASIAAPFTSKQSSIMCGKNYLLIIFSPDVFRLK